MGSVLATDPDDDTLIYSVLAGHGDGKLAINGCTGAAAALVKKLGLRRNEFG